MSAASMFDEAATTRALQQLGARFDPETLQSTRALYRVGTASLPWAGREGVYDLVYGTEERHRLDVYPPDRPNSPILLFVHGGGFVGGDKRSDPVFYGNVGRYFAAHGFLTILPNYRLAPAATWPSGNEDVAAVLDWIGRYAGDYGGDTSRIVLIGQSAGAAHIAGYLFDPRWRARDNGSIRGAALMSGFYRAKTPLVGGPSLYFGEDQTTWRDRSAATHVSAAHPPILLTVAELDPATIAEHTFDLAMALNAADGRAPQLCWFRDHNHVSTVHGLGLGQDSVGRALREFAARHV